MQYDAYLFDLYGTLIDIRTHESNPALWETVAAHYSALERSGRAKRSGKRTRRNARGSRRRRPKIRKSTLRRSLKRCSRSAA